MNLVQKVCIALSLMVGLSFAQTAPVVGQDVPDKVIGAGLGLSSTESPEPTGWFSICKKEATRTLVCLANDMAIGTGVTSTRMDIEYLVGRYKNVFLFDFVWQIPAKYLLPFYYSYTDF